MNEATRLCVDFNSRTPDGKVVFNEQSAKVLETDLGEPLRPGIPLTLFDEELEVDAVLTFDEQFKVWAGIPNWHTQRDRLSFGDSEFGSAYQSD